MIKLLVIADDFTGALDTGVQFSNLGIATLVSTNINIDYAEVDQTIEVLVIDTESRYLSYEEAYRKVKDVLERARAQGILYIYKKVDSAFRGNISGEIAAVLESFPARMVSFLPAYPEMNRVLINGDLYIDDQLASQSVFAQDPYEPVTESNILKRLKNEAGIEAQLVREGKLPENTNGLVVFDAQRDEELRLHADYLAELGQLSLTIGCAGFAKFLAQKLFPESSPRTYTLKKPLVVISGSINPITKQQIEHAQAKNAPRISLQPEQLLKPNYWSSDEGQGAVAEYLSLMEEHPLIVFETLHEETSQGIGDYSDKYHLGPSDVRFRIGQSLGELSRSIWGNHTESTFLFTGGDTLFQSMEVLGIKAIKTIAEISAGVVLSEINWQGKDIQVITKSGGFGHEQLFTEISQLVE